MRNNLVIFFFMCSCASSTSKVDINKFGVTGFSEVKIGSEMVEIKSRFGEPSRRQKNGQVDTWFYSDRSGFERFSVSFENGIVSSKLADVVGSRPKISELDCKECSFQKFLMPQCDSESMAPPIYVEKGKGILIFVRKDDMVDSVLWKDPAKIDETLRKLQRCNSVNEFKKLVGA